jgi:hypothetical protein
MANLLVASPFCKQLPPHVLLMLLAQDPFKRKSCCKKLTLQQPLASHLHSAVLSVHGSFIIMIMSKPSTSYT